MGLVTSVKPESAQKSDQDSMPAERIE